MIAEMEAKGLEAKTVGLKIKTTKFEVRTQDHTGQTYVGTADELFAAASAMLHREIRGASMSSPGGVLRLRLMGVKACSFRGQAGAPVLPGQVTMDEFLSGDGGPDADEGWSEHADEAPTTAKTSDIASGAGDRSLEAELGTKSRGGSTTLRETNARDTATAPAPSQAGRAVDSHVSLSPVTCPICGKELDARKNAALNRHLDACLSECSPSSADNSERIRSGESLERRRLVQERVDRGRPRPPHKKSVKESRVGIERFFATEEPA